MGFKERILNQPVAGGGCFSPIIALDPWSAYVYPSNGLLQSEATYCWLERKFDLIYSLIWLRDRLRATDNNMNWCNQIFTIMMKTKFIRRSKSAKKISSCRLTYIRITRSLFTASLRTRWFPGYTGARGCKEICLLPLITLLKSQ